MDRYRRLILKLLLSACLPLFLLCSTANAYILKGEHVLQLMIERNNLPVRLFVKQQHTFWNSDLESVNTQYDEWARYRIPEEFRSDIDTGSFKKIEVVTPGRCLTIIDGKIVAQTESWVDHYTDLFYYRTRKRMVEKLEDLGINFSVTSLGRYNGLICYVIGAEYPDESVPQIWIDKETFEPVRWIFKIFTKDGVVEKKEILYGEWKSYYNSRYPSLINFYEGQNQIQSISVQKVEMNPPLSEDLFDIDQLIRVYSVETPVDQGTTGKSDVEKRIEEFKKIYE